MKNAFVGSLAVALLMMAGCSNDVASQGDAVVFSASVPVTYGDIESLARDSKLVVVATVDGSRQEKIADLEVTRYELTVDQDYSAASPKTIGVYQTGTEDWILDTPIPPHLKVGNTYLLFLVPMGLPEGQVGSDGFGIVGVGAWERQGDAFRAYLNPDHELTYGQIPTQIGISELKTMIPLDLVGLGR